MMIKLRLAFCYLVLACAWLKIGGKCAEASNDHGLGTKILRTQDTDIKGQVGGLHDQNPLFKGLRDDEAKIKDKFVEIIKGMRIKLVAPNQQLRKMMNSISTKTRIMFLKDYDRYFKHLYIGLTSRPMLYAHLGLYFAGKNLVQEWYKPYQGGNFQRHVLDSCRSLMKVRRDSIKLNKENLYTLVMSKAKVKGKFYLAYLVFQNNLNLFMLDNYLQLCSMLEPDQLEVDIKKLEPSFEFS